MQQRSSKMDALVASEYGSTANREEAVAAQVVIDDDMIDDDSPPPPTKQQKIIKAVLFIVLLVIVIYVILDYTVRAPSDEFPGKRGAPTTPVSGASRCCVLRQKIRWGTTVLLCHLVLGRRLNFSFRCQMLTDASTNARNTTSGQHEIEPNTRALKRCGMNQHRATRIQ